MAPCRFCKHQGVAAGGLALLAALVVVGLALPGGAAAQQDDGKDVEIADRIRDVCTTHLDDDIDPVFCAFGEEKDIAEGCCDELVPEVRDATSCGCGVLKVIEGRGIDFNKVCNSTGIEKACHDVAEREDKLSKLNPCGRFFERFAGGDTSKITPEDARGCLQAINTCTASCQKQ